MENKVKKITYEKITTDENNLKIKITNQTHIQYEFGVDHSDEFIAKNGIILRSAGLPEISKNFLKLIYVRGGANNSFNMLPLNFGNNYEFFNSVCDAFDEYNEYFGGKSVKKIN